MNGLSNNHKKWGKIRFSKQAIILMWRYNVVTILRGATEAGEVKISNEALNA